MASMQKVCSPTPNSGTKSGWRLRTPVPLLGRQKRMVAGSSTRSKRATSCSASQGSTRSPRCRPK
eukprot:39417-Heterocapsa_arctica.AAC.1